MKKATLWIIAIFFAGHLQAQNPMFVDFAMPKSDLVMFLKNRGTVKFQDAGPIVKAISGDNCLEYRYNQEGKLYRIDMFRNFTKKKEAEENLANMLNFFKAQQTTLFQEINTPEKAKHVAIKDDVVNEVYLLKNGNTGYQVKIIKKSLASDPNTESKDDLEPSMAFSL